MIKKYTKFLEEVTIKGNQGIPNSPDYLSNVERRARTRLGDNGRPIPEGDPEMIMRNGQEFMNLVSRSSRMIRGKERELEELAKEVILSNYGSILDGVELDIRIGNPSQLMRGEEGDPDPIRKTDDVELRREVDKAKILNNIIQGEAKNTKNILHSDQVKDGINGIFGDVDGKIIFDIWDKVTKIADKMDWMIPVSVKSDMMENAPQGMGGAVKVEWKAKEKDTEEDRNELADRILKSLEDGNDLDDNSEDISDLFEETSPKITAIGVDFPMLLHETVKGIYELIAAHSIPIDSELADKIKSNVTSFDDEAEDFRYGPEIAADLRDFVNSSIDDMSKSNSDIWEIENLREFVFGKMVDREYLPTDEFLLLFKGILSKTDSAKSKIKSIIGDVIKELNDVDESPMSTYDDSDYDDSDDEYPTQGQMEDEETVDDEEVDYTSMSKKDLERMIDSSLDTGDFDKVKELTSVLNKLYPEK